MKKKLFPLLFLLAFVAAFAWKPAVSHAAAYVHVGVEDNKPTKVGKYYFTRLYSNANGYLGFSIKKSLNGKVYKKLGENTEDFFTNGKYLFYVKDDQKYIYRMTLSSKKIQKYVNLKSAGWNIINMYGSSIYINQYASNNKMTLKMVTSKKKIKTITTNGDAPCIAEGRYLLYKIYGGASVGQMCLRDCKTGKTTTIPEMKDAVDNAAILNGNVAFIQYVDSVKNYAIKVYNIATKTCRTVTTLTDDSFYSGAGTFSSDLSTYTYMFTDSKTGKETKCIVNMTDGTIIRK